MLYGSTDERPRLAQKVQVPNIQVLWSQIPLRVWLLEPESLNIGYLDALGWGVSLSSSVGPS